MPITDAVTYGVQALLLGVAIYVAVHTLAHPTRHNIHILGFFTLLALVITYVWVQAALEVVPGSLASLGTVLLISALPYVLLRLANTFSSVPRSRMRVAEIGLLSLTILVTFIGAEHLIALAAFVTYFVATSGYTAYRFHQGSQGANGITRKRLRSLAIASTILAAALFTLIFSALADGAVQTAFDLSRQAMLGGAGVMFLAGFAPPRLVRQAWQEPALRDFLNQTLRAPRWSSMRDLLRHFEEAAANTVGAPNATIGLWNPESGLIEFWRNQFEPGETIGGRAFLEQRPILSDDSISDDPASREIYERAEAYAIMAVPITTDDARIGVIALYSPNPPIFAEDDLHLLGLLADLIAILLENRRHLEAQAELAAREETARLKDEFLSVAAHDLKTPLTTILATGQYLERRLLRSDTDTPEINSTRRLNREARRLQALVQGLLDASRIERGQLVTSPEPTDLSELIHDLLERTDVRASRNLHVEVEEGLTGAVDGVRIQQVLENLLENARKYSPPDSSIHVAAWAEGDTLRFSVRDEGPGISPDEHEQIFDRYFRSPNSNDSAEPGIGLGLYICREIIQQHGGHIWVESEPGRGATFHVSLQRMEVAAVEYDTANSRR